MSEFTATLARSCLVKLIITSGPVGRKLSSGSWRKWCRTSEGNLSLWLGYDDLSFRQGLSDFFFEPAGGIRVSVNKKEFLGACFDGKF
jgi:hypothetical protein